MYGDVVDLREFYASHLGQVVRRLVRRQIRQMWPDVGGMRVLGIGYATPFLRPFREEAERAIAVMPAGQGVSFWPPEGPGLVALSEEGELPLPDNCVDRVLLVHALEFTEHLRPLMREIWRVMAGGGRLIAIVPNRRGIWARSDVTPFGHGSPFSPGQLRQTLRANLFVPEREERALFFPPVRSRFLLAGAGAWEKVGQRWLPAFAGANITEASKQIYASAGHAERKRERRLLPAAAAARPALQPRGHLRLVYPENR